MTRPVVWTIAGSDPGGGAGIQADLKTMNALQVHGCSVITALTAQNTLGVFRTEPVSDDMLLDQLKSLRDDLPPVVVKIGMLYSGHVMELILPYLRDLEAPIVYDPLMASTSGTTLLDDTGRQAMLTELLPLVDVLTPNLPEAGQLLGREVKTVADIEQAAADLLELGVKAVLIKGGHRNQPLSQDYWTDGRQSFWMTSETQMTLNTHGTGCTLSSAMAAFLARGHEPLDAAVLAKAYVNQGLREAKPLGKGRGPLYHGGWPNRPGDLPWIEERPTADGRRYAFPALDELPIGLYPVVDSAAWVDKLLPLGIRIIQLRIKDLTGLALEEEIAEAARLARLYGARLFVNDYWQQAVKHDVYGVHLGQDDLHPEAIDAVFRAGLRLGVSTHSYAELARAWSLQPSYMALGTVFKSPSKTFSHTPIGVDRFARMRQMIPVPTVAIGGITARTAQQLVDAGADGIAVISDLTQAEDLRGRIARWENVRW